MVRYNNKEVEKVYMAGERKGFSSFVKAVMLIVGGLVILFLLLMAQRGMIFEIEEPIREFINLSIGGL